MAFSLLDSFQQVHFFFPVLGAPELAALHPQFCIWFLTFYFKLFKVKNRVVIQNRKESIWSAPLLSMNNVLHKPIGTCRFLSTTSSPLVFSDVWYYKISLPIQNGTFSSAKPLSAVSHCLLAETQNLKIQSLKKFYTETRFSPLLRPNGLESLMPQGEPWQALADVMQDAIKLPFFRMKPYKEVTEEILSTKFWCSCIPEVLLKENPPCNWIFSLTSFKTAKKVKSYSSYWAQLMSSWGFSSCVCYQHNTQNSLCSDH